MSQLNADLGAGFSATLGTAFSEVTVNGICAREILDSRGYPTIEVEVHVTDLQHPKETVVGTAIVPSGASTGEGEALELRDGDRKRYSGKGVLKAVNNVREKISPHLVTRKFSTLAQLDEKICELDGTPGKSKLGANAILGVSMAFCRAHALAQRIPTYEYLATLYGTPGTLLPVPMMNIINGGKHADNGLGIQEFMIVPAGLKTFSESLRAGAEIFHQLKKILHQEGLSTGVGDEGGFAPVFKGTKPHEQALTYLIRAITDAGYEPGKQVFLAIDSAASEFSTAQRGTYRFEERDRTAEELIAIYNGWLEKFPLISIEDGLSEHDWAGWKQMTRNLGKKCQLIGDDLFVTNPVFLKKGIENQSANAILIKLNQIGTVSETLQTMHLAASADYRSVTSHRSGESEDTFIADLAVGTDCGQIKTGSASRTDRIAKYNQLLRLEERLGNRARYAGLKTYERFLD